jgi:histo-blood group ABO system transferase
MKRIKLNLIATNNYTFFLEGIMESARNFFAKDCKLDFIVYTNSDDVMISEDVKKIHIDDEEWPMPTLKRFHYFLKAKKEILDSDYSFYVDVDSIFIKEININEIIGNKIGLIGTLHPGFIGNCGTPERNPLSKAYIPHGHTDSYFCGGFFGADSESFIKMSDDISKAIDDDLNNGIIAIWHDESHLNKYFFMNKPSVILGDGFTEPEGYDINRNPYLVFLDKGGEDKKKELRNKKIA